MAKPGKPSARSGPPSKWPVNKICEFCGKAVAAAKDYASVLIFTFNGFRKTKERKTGHKGCIK
jgi:hypothetical protein